MHRSEEKHAVKIYFAGPLFTQAERRWNAEVARSLRETFGYQVFLPQEHTDSILEGKKPFNPKEIYSQNEHAIREATIVVAILDGADSDSGTSWECGFAKAIGLPVIGVRTDFRKGGDDPKTAVNLMLSESCRRLIVISPAKASDLPWLLGKIHEAINEAIPPA
jgi:nucleoside 2-deoxyribosyltransferase